jgi:hypothetical protein
MCQRRACSIPEEALATEIVSGGNPDARVQVEAFMFAGEERLGLTMVGAFLSLVVLARG